MKGLRSGLLFMLLAIIFIVVGCSADSSTDNVDENVPNNQTNEDPEVESESGGDLKVALQAQPSIIDPHVTTETVTYISTKPIYEALVVSNEQGQPVPYLAETIDITDDNKTYTFHLREGVKFHNGKEMTAEDVVASMNRWKENATGAKVIIGDDEFKMIDDDTVELTLTTPSALVPTLIATERLPAIMPKELVEAAGMEAVAEVIGTGPFKFVEWRQDQYLHLEKNEDYVPFDEPTDGLAEKREALVDDLYFYFVTDPSTRMAGLQTGEYDIDAAVVNQNFMQVNEDPKMKTFVEPSGSPTVYFNKSKGIFTDVNMRQAFNAALDVSAIMKAAYSEDELYSLSHSYIHENFADWYSEGGEESYNQNDPEKAKALLEEAGYDGEKITFITTRDYEDYYNASVVIQEQLSELGVNIDIEVTDWATLLDKRADPDQWDLFISGYNVKPQPIGLLPLDPEYPGWTDDPKIEELKKVIQTTSYDEAKAAWDELQSYAWNEYLPVVVLGYKNTVSATSDKVEGYTTDNGQPILWNTRKVE